MSHTDAAIGMMDGAYFTSRNDILNFLNSLLDLNLRKIEETASGAVACQLVEYIFPNSIPMSRVNWSARSGHEYVANYKLLQNGFTRNKIQKYVDVDKLIRGKYQDNLEFCQWLKAFFDQTSPMMRDRREGYDPAAVRARGKGGKTVQRGTGGNNAAAAGRNNKPSMARSSRTTTTGASSSSRPSARSTAGGGAAASRPASGTGSTTSPRRGAVRNLKENTSNSSRQIHSNNNSNTNPRKQSSAASSAAVARYTEEIRALKLANDDHRSKYTELERASAETQLQLRTVESERDFYFEKLRGIEVMLQVYKEREDEAEGSGDVRRVMDSIFRVMYATMEDDVVVTDEGELLGDITVENSMDKSALSSMAQDDHLGDEEGDVDDDEEEEQFLPNKSNDVSGEGDANVIDQSSGEEHDDLLGDDDGELLTSGLDDPVVVENEPVADKADVGGGEFEDEQLVLDDDYSDEDLLSSDEDLRAD